ncbi:hypothetical protein AB4037_08475 [Labrys sp. KB_33_2]|uniref:hypothetical protein n=1 Tax=Labrys sp. KB_33_2 TaxID=3237479 RepID=UPI003F8FA48D
MMVGLVDKISSLVAMPTGRGPTNHLSDLGDIVEQVNQMANLAHDLVASFVVDVEQIAPKVFMRQFTEYERDQLNFACRHVAQLTERLKTDYLRAIDCYGA